jgi:hypothetical protein
MSPLPAGISCVTVTAAPSNVSLRFAIVSSPTLSCRACPMMPSAVSVVRVASGSPIPTEKPGMVKRPQLVASNPCTPRYPSQKLARSCTAAATTPHRAEAPHATDSSFEMTLPVSRTSVNRRPGSPNRASITARGTSRSSDSTVRSGSTSSVADVPSRDRPAAGTSG